MSRTTASALQSVWERLRASPASTVAASLAVFLLMAFGMAQLMASLEPKELPIARLLETLSTWGAMIAIAAPAMALLTCWLIARIKPSVGLLAAGVVGALVVWAPAVTLIGVAGETIYRWADGAVPDIGYDAMAFLLLAVIAGSGFRGTLTAGRARHQRDAGASRS